QRLVEGVQPSLMREELADGDAVLALLREFRPVGAHALFIVQPPARMSDRKRHGGQPFCSRIDYHHRVPLPGFAGLLVSNATPDVDDFLAVVVGAASRAELMPPSEVVGEYVPHVFTAPCDASTERRSA